MNSSVSPLTPRESLKDRAPALAQRLAGILLAVAGLVARRFLQKPRLVGLIGPMWRWLTHVASRFERSVTGPARARTARSAPATQARVRAARLPTRRGWLVRELGWEAAGYGSQLAHLLAEPDMQALIAAMPGVGRVLRPLCRMLGMKLADVTMLVPPLVAVVAPSVWAADDGVELAGVAGGNSGFATSG